MEILTEFDELQAALAKVNMDESVLPYVNGRLVDDAAFNKTQKILNCPEMISAHKYLYNLDMDQLTEEDIGKIDQLYKLGCDRGFIIDDLTKWDDNGEEEQEVAAVEAPVDAQPKNTLFKAKIPCWTVIYSATKDGDIKTGEAYSNAVSINAAKADVNAKLSQCGYDNITILAIENCTNAPKSQDTSNATEEVSAIEVSEADEDDSSSDDSSEEDSSEEDTSDDDSSEDDTSGNDDSDDTSNDDDSNDDADDESDESSSDDTDSDDDSSDDSTDEDSDSSDDEEDDTDDKSSDDKSDELDPNEKSELRDLYRKTFKNILVKCKFDTSFNDLTLEQKVKFFTELSKAWKKDYEPQDFMTDKEIEQLNNVVAQKTSGDSDDSSDDAE